MTTQTIPPWKTTKISRHPRLMLLFILALFIMPVAAAWSVFNLKLWPEHQVNLGTLIKPAVSIGNISFVEDNGKILDTNTMRKKWWLVYATESECNDECQRILTLIRQINIALGKDSDRVQRLLISTTQFDKNTNEQLKARFPDLHRTITEPNLIKNLLEKALRTPNVLQQHNVYIIDPLGNLMMVYPEKLVGKPIIKDLTRLLKYSQVG